MRIDVDKYVDNPYLIHKNQKDIVLIKAIFSGGR